MKSLKSIVLSNFDHPWMPISVLLLFFGLFVGVIWWVMRKESKNLYDEVEQLPLQDLEEEEAQGEKDE